MRAPTPRRGAFVADAPGGSRALVLLAGVAFGLAAGCSERPAEPQREAGTVRMAERLREIAAEIEPQRHPYVSSARLDSALALELPSDPRERITFRATLALESLHAGLFDQAISRFGELIAEIDPRGDQVPANLGRAILESEGLTHLKLWERESCVTTRTSRPCLLPIAPYNEPRAVHAARAAKSRYTSLLQLRPDHAMYRWFLSLASMMLGEYPEGVPEGWRIPPESFQSEYELSEFPEIAAALGLDVEGHAGGSIVDDFDGDGRLDLFASSWHLRDQLRYFRNDGDGTFSDRTLEAGLEGIVGGLNLVQADYDNDGDLDVFVLRGAWAPYGEPNSLLRNNGDGTFEDVTEAAGVYSEHPTQTAAWGDYDNDGWLDLYIGNESSGRRRIPNELYRNDGDGTFTEVAAATGTAIVGFVKAVIWGDYDNDGRLDLYISRLREPNVLLRNEGPAPGGRWRFTEVTPTAGVAEPLASFPAWFWDYDNDGWLDLFVSGYRAVTGDIAAEYLGLPHDGESPRLYRNRGDGTFEDVTESARLDRVLLTMGSNYGDLDNDGYEDFYAGTGDARFQTIIPNRMFRNADGALFQDVTSAGGFGHLGKGHGVAFADIDGDGDQDIYVTMGGAYEGDVARNVLWENPGQGSRWITLRLEGVQSNRSAIGARIRVEVRTPSGAREIHRSVGSGGSFGANSLQQEIGLGRATGVDAVEIHWPTSGVTDRFTDVEMDRVYRVREGEHLLELVALTPVRLGTDRPPSRP